MKLDIPCPMTHEEASSILTPLRPIINAEGKARGREPRLYVSGKGHRGPVWIAGSTPATGGPDDIDVGFFDSRVCTLHADGESLTIRDGSTETGKPLSRSTANFLNGFLKARNLKLQSLGQDVWMVRPLDPTATLAGQISLFQGLLYIGA